jgi:hypothetical protein
VNKYFPLSRFLSVSLRPLFGIYGYDNTLAAKAFCSALDKKMILDCRCIYGYFVRAGIKEIADIVKIPDAPANSERHKDIACCPGNDIKNDFAPLMGSGDIQEHQLVSAFAVVKTGIFNRVTGIL